MEKNNELSKYKNARTLILFLAIVTVISCSVLIAEGSPFSRTSILPQMGIALSLTMDEPARSILMLLSIVFPVVVYGISFHLCKKQYKWMMLGLVLISLDAGAFILFLVIELMNLTEGTIPSTYLFDMIIEFTFLVYIIKGYRAGKKLNNDFEEIPMEKIIDKDKGAKVYSFDKRLADRNKADKSNWLLLAILTTLAIVILDLYMLTVLIQANQDNTSLALVLFFAILIIVCVVFVFVYIYLRPYIGVRTAHYYLKDDVVTRYSSTSAIGFETFPNLQYVRETKSTYVCNYAAEKKIKKLIIPKCYPGIEKLIKR